MSTTFNIIRASIFLILASFASTALSVMVNSESGTASLDGVWAFPDSCYGGPDPFPDPPGENDSNEFLIFQGNTVESREVEWASIDGSCSGSETIIASETFTFMVTGDGVSPGWVVENEFDIEVPAPPPPRQDGSGLLDPTPFVTTLAILIPGEDSETGLWYIDDTGGDDPAKPWLLWRNAGEDDAPSVYMSTEEPLYRTDFPVDVIPAPAAIWLFGTGLIGLVGFTKRRKAA